MYSKLEYFGKASDATIIKLSGGTLTINLKNGRQHMVSGAHIVHASYYPGKAQNNA